MKAKHTNWWFQHCKILLLTELCPYILLNTEYLAKLYLILISEVPTWDLHIPRSDKKKFKYGTAYVNHTLVLKLLTHTNRLVHAHTHVQGDLFPSWVMFVKKIIGLIRHLFPLFKFTIKVPVDNSEVCAFSVRPETKGTQTQVQGFSNSVMVALGSSHIPKASIGGTTYNAYHIMIQIMKIMVRPASMLRVISNKMGFNKNSMY